MTLYTGTNKKDTISGGVSNDVIYGLDDDDLIQSGAGDDSIDGGNGNDAILGEDGNDLLIGGQGDDTLDGGSGADDMEGDSGNDVYYVDNLYDFIYDTSGKDTAYVSTSFVKIPSSIETVIYTNGAMALPYWIDALLPDDAAGLDYKLLLGKTTVMQYAFPQSIPSYNTSVEDANGYVGFKSLQIARTKEALAYISSIIDIQYVETSNPNQANTLSFANNTQADSAGYALYPSATALGSDVFLDKDSSGTFTLKNGQYQTLALIHEIGHALGLEHPFSTPGATGSTSDPPYFIGTEDSTTWTVMSYTDFPAQYYLKYSPLDIAALQYLYGPSKASRIGDDTYQLSESSPNFIWDGGGSDTIDANHFTEAASIYLAPGYWGYAGSAKADKITNAGQITVNFGTVIENLVGTHYNDQLYGNDVANNIEGSLGNDTLCGGLGNDTLDGGLGIDTAIWNFASNQYQLTRTDLDWYLTDKKGVDGTDTVSNIEKLQFTDRTVIIESQSHGSYSDIPSDLYQFFITAFNAAPGVTYMDQLADAYRWFKTSEANPAKKIVDTFTTKTQFTDVYSPTLTHTDMATQLINNIVKSSATTTAKSQAIEDIKGALDIGWTVGDVIYTVFGNLAQKSLTDTYWGNTAKQFNNQIAVAKYYTETLNQSTTDLETLRDVIQPVTQSTDVSSDNVVAQLIGVALMTGGTGL
jgi:Ca2+-binding RTX toxin-like protein